MVLMLIGQVRRSTISLANKHNNNKNNMHYSSKYLGSATWILSSHYAYIKVIYMNK